MKEKSIYLKERLEGEFLPVLALRGQATNGRPYGVGFKLLRNVSVERGSTKVKIT